MFVRSTDCRRDLKQSVEISTSSKDEPQETTTNVGPTPQLEEQIEGGKKKRKQQVIEEGSLVLMYASKERITPLLIQKGQIFNNKFGSFYHDSLIGQPFGSKIVARDGRGWIHALFPTPELWTSGAVTHRTQIIYSTDISYISLQLDLAPGSIVVESGTGTGSLSTSITRTIAPSGHLYTFEFHAMRAEKAREDFRRNGIDEFITVEQRDVLKNGFGLPKGCADAVFLDLPAPWDAVPYAEFTLRPNGRLCSFSPCIEQVQQTCDALRANAFTDIITVECLARTLEIHHQTQLEEAPGVWDPSQETTPVSKEEEEKETDSSSSKRQKTEDGSIKHTTTKRKLNGQWGATPTSTTPALWKPGAQSRGHTSYLTFATRKMKR